MRKRVTIVTTENQQQRIIAAVDAAFDEQLTFTADLVRIPSLRGDENAAQDVLEQAYREIGLTIDRWTLDAEELAEHPGAGAVSVSYENSDVVVGSFAPEVQTGKSLILNGHVDVVPIGSERLWSRSPWEPHVAEGWLYGRGTGDMKAGLVANLFALRALRAAGLTPASPVYLQSVPEEESTGNGTISALQHGYTADAVLISEPSQTEVVRAHVGVIWFSVTVTGQAAHAFEMSTGSNAIDGAYAVIEELRRMEEEWNERAATSEHFGSHDHPLNLNVGVITAGDWPSSVPDSCEVQFRVSITPEMDVDESWREITERVQVAVQSDTRLNRSSAVAKRLGFYSDGYVLEPGSEAEATLSAAHTRATGKPLGEVAMPGYIDSRCYGLFADVPALVYGPVGEKLHGADERVNIESIREVTRTLALFIAQWCGVTEA
ncbi:ArgE/DapE family deacylase [Leucobacter chinensis]|uniref:ArgE/DapE family deacylase n=1 Tax=Leucobacter chinensis TaxID=2851010 RepID=UPI001C220F88|nr:ArgE/DapE family deacylase [Leucobacter chinensis]